MLMNPHTTQYFVWDMLATVTPSYDLMDQLCLSVWHCIKGKQCHHITITSITFFFVFNAVHLIFFWFSVNWKSVTQIVLYIHHLLESPILMVTHVSQQHVGLQQAVFKVLQEETRCRHTLVSCIQCDQIKIAKCL